MPTEAYFGDTYPSDLDPATADLWGAILNNLFVNQGARDGRVYAGGTIIAPENKDYNILPDIRFPGTVQRVSYWTDAGTATVNTKVNSTTVTNGNVSATTTKQTNSPTANDSFVAGNDIKISVSSVSGVGELYYALYLDRSGAGTA